MLSAEDLQPDVGPFSFYLDAFKELGTCRTSSMSVGPIPFTAIVEYSKIYDVGDFDEFLFLIRHMDDTLLELESEKGNKDGKGNKAHKN